MTGLRMRFTREVAERAKPTIAKSSNRSHRITLMYTAIATSTSCVSERTRSTGSRNTDLAPLSSETRLLTLGLYCVGSLGTADTRSS